MELNQLTKFKGLKVTGVSLENNKLHLEFNKKVLFLNLKKSVNIYSSENLNNLATKAIQDSILKDVIILNNNIIKLEFNDGSKFNYTLSFKVSNLD